jgi:hypothetical protein
MVSREAQALSVNANETNKSARMIGPSFNLGASVHYLRLNIRSYATEYEPAPFPGRHRATTSQSSRRALGPGVPARASRDRNDDEIQRQRDLNESIL